MPFGRHASAQTRSPAHSQRAQGQFWARPALLCRGTSAQHAGVRRSIAVAYAAAPQQQHLLGQSAAAAAARPDGTDEGGKPKVIPVVTRPSLPCDKPLPLANVLEVQRLLYLLEAPEYCLRAFREHGVNGQDLLALKEDDLEDPRFKFPKHVQRKVMRIAVAWRTFQNITGSPTRGGITVDQYVAYYSYGRSPEVVPQLQAAYRVVDANSNGTLTFEEFLVGFSLLDAAVAESRRPTPAPPELASGSSSAGGSFSWFQL